MRTNIDIDRELLVRAMELTGARTQREAVDIALQLLVSSETAQVVGRLMQRGVVQNALKDR